MPISFAEFRLNETARIALPIFVRKIIHCRSSISAMETAKIKICEVEIVAFPKSVILLLSSKVGKDFGVPVKMKTNKYSINKDIQIAVISVVIPEYFRT